LSGAALLFSETPSRILISAPESSVAQILSIAAETDTKATVIGKTIADQLKIAVNGERVIDRPVSEVESAWRGVLPKILEIPSLVAAADAPVSH
jgi:phosphoribosylformylglycinamidine synthase